MAEAARWLEWQGRDAVVRTASVALAAGAATTTAGAFLHAVFTPGANRWLRVPSAATRSWAPLLGGTKYAMSPAQPLAPVIAVARRLLALTATLRPEPRPLEELHGPADGACDADGLVEAALAVPGLRLRVLRLGRTHALSPRVAIAALRAWGPTSLTEWHAGLGIPNNIEMPDVLQALAACTMLRVLRCDDIDLCALPLLPSLRVLTTFRYKLYRSPSGAPRVDALATSCPALECLYAGPARAASPSEWTRLFAQIPSLTQIIWSDSQGPALWVQTMGVVPERVPAPQARRVASSWDISDEPYAELYPNVSEMYFTQGQPCSPTAVAVLCALTQLRVLVITPNAAGRSYDTNRFDSDLEYIPTDAQTAQILASLPLLEHLDVSVYNGHNPYLTFATADYADIVAPRLRTLKIAAAWRLRGRGLRNVTLVCPNLRHLDVRAAFAMSRHEFIDALVEFRAAADAVNAHAKTPLEQRLRLPKLRRLYSVYRPRWLPKALNFVTYCSGRRFRR
jgi:hypothetical protein